MIPLSLTAIAEKNKIAGDSCWPILLEIRVPNSVTLYLARNNEDVIWGGRTWQAFPFDIDPVEESSAPEIPALTLKCSNIGREILGYIEASEGGGTGATVVIRVVNTKHLNLTTPEIQLEFRVQQVKYDSNWVSFTLGGSQMVGRRVPERRYLKDFCPFIYGGVECGLPPVAVLAYPTCKKTLTDCRERSNSQRFGGDPSVPVGGVYASN